jgi:hypothetical protein
MHPQILKFLIVLDLGKQDLEKYRRSLKREKSQPNIFRTDGASRMTSYSSQLFQMSYEIQGLRDANLDEDHHRVFPNRWFRGWWEALRPNQPSQVSSHHRCECDKILDGRGTRTPPSS